MDAHSPTLTALLPSTPYTLAYALPLLLLSLLITFAGTFLTLDRTRSFPKSEGYAAIPAPGGFDLAKKKQSKFVWQLQGGIGGLAGGYVFGLHFATALGLLIPATTNSAALSSKSFLPVWILSCAVTTWLAGRYRYAALGFFGMTGGTLFALALCVIIHPSLPSRVILVSVFMPLFCVLVAITTFIPRASFALLHPFLRLCTSSTGAFGTVLAISLLTNPPITQWANVWERLWMEDGDGWGSGKEQGLSAAFGVFVAVGCLSDWALKRWIGECPDEKWDSYLAHYAANLPNQADRAGTFQPLSSFWDRIFGPPASSRDMPIPQRKAKDSDSKEIIFPSDADMKSTGSKSKAVPLSLPVDFSMNNLGPGKLSKNTPETGAAFVPSKDILKKAKKHRKKFFAYDEDEDEGKKKKRKPVKFGAVDDLSSDSSDDEKLDDEWDGDPKSPLSAASTPQLPPTGIKKAPLPNRTHTGATVVQSPADPLSRTHSSSAPTLVDGEVPNNNQQNRQEKHVPSRKHSYQADDDHLLATLDYDAEIARLKEMRRREGREGSETFKIRDEYSDYEDDKQGNPRRNRAEGPRARGQNQRRYTQPPTGHNHAVRGAGVEEGGDDNGHWTPGFMKRHQSLQQPSSTGMNLDDEPLLQHPGRVPTGSAPPPATFVPVPVPATPSLIKALDRIRVAQEEVYGPAPGIRLGESGDRRRRGTRSQSQAPSQPRWDEFWREVKTKAASGGHS